MRDDATLWLNLGDSFARSQTGNVPQTKADYLTYLDHSKNGSSDGAVGRANRPGSRAGADFLKPKDLCLIPHRVAIALQEDGWYVRMDIIWQKPSPMPESVTDRPTKAHEYIFLLTKEPRYFYDHEAVKEPYAQSTLERDAYTRITEGKYEQVGKGNTTADGVGRRTAGLVSHEQSRSPNGRNRRSVWTVATKPLKLAHFAVFPPTLIEPCILAGTSQHGCCSDCGAPFERVVKRESNWQERKAAGAWAGNVGVSDNYQNGVHGKGMSHDLGGLPSKTTGWQPTCSCNADVRPCTVLDPFSGSGTTGLVSLAKGRHYVGIEINPEYAEMSRRRITDAAPLFNHVTVEALP